MFLRETWRWQPTDASTFFSRHGQLLEFDPERKKLERLDLWVPDSDREHVNMPYALAIDATGSRIYGKGTWMQDFRLFELTVEAGSTPRIREIGSVVKKTDPRTAHAVTVGADGDAYYATDHDTKLRRYDPSSEKMLLLGDILLSNVAGGKLISCWAAAAARDGTIWLAGWLLEPSRKAKDRRRRIGFVAYRPQAR
jgi:hypothetical protein